MRAAADPHDENAFTHAVSGSLSRYRKGRCFLGEMMLACRETLLSTAISIASRHL